MPNTGPPSNITANNTEEVFERTVASVASNTIQNAPLTVIAVEPSGPGSTGATSNNYPASDGRAHDITAAPG